MTETETTQLTFNGETTDEEYERPTTMIHCCDCDEWIFRTRRFEHTDDGHLIVDPLEQEPPTEERWEEESVAIVGGRYDVTTNYTVEYRQTVIARSKQHAKEIARDNISVDDTPDDCMHVHDEVYRMESITEDDERAEELY